MSHEGQAPNFGAIEKEAGSVTRDAIRLLWMMLNHHSRPAPLSAPSGGGNAFGIVTAAGQPALLADSSSDTLTLTGDESIGYILEPGTDTVQINFTGAIGPIAVAGGTSTAIFGTNRPSLLDVEQLVQDLTQDRVNISTGAKLTLTGTIGTVPYGIYNTIYTSSADTATYTYGPIGLYSECAHEGSGSVDSLHGVMGVSALWGSGSINQSHGVAGIGDSWGSGTVTFLDGTVGQVNPRGTATITNAVCLHAITCSITGSDTFTNMYGVYVDDLGYGTNRWAFRSFGATDTVQIAGPVIWEKYLQTSEQGSAPAAPAGNGVRIYAIDNGAGKTQLMALFSSGAAQQLAIQP